MILSALLLSLTILLDSVQHATMRYMWDGAEPHSQMALERIHLDGSASPADSYSPFGKAITRFVIAEFILTFAVCCDATRLIALRR